MIVDRCKSYLMITIYYFITYLIAAKHVLRYLKGTLDYGLKFDANKKINLHGYVDSDWEGSATDRKRTSSCCFSLGSGMISSFKSMLLLAQITTR